MGKGSSTIENGSYCTSYVNVENESPIRNSLRRMRKEYEFDCEDINSSTNDDNKTTSRVLSYGSSTGISASSQLLLSLRKMNSSRSNIKKNNISSCKSTSSSAPVRWEEKLNEHKSKNNNNNNNNKIENKIENENYYVNSNYNIQRQIELLNKNIDEKSSRWESVILDFHRKLEIMCE